MRAHARVRSASGAAPPDTDIRRGDATLQAVAVLGATAGVFLVVDIAVITITNSHIEPLDSILFFIGLGAMILTLVALAVHLSTGHEGPARVAYGVLAFLAVLVVLGTIAAAADAAGSALFSPANIGLHGEWSFFSSAICLLLIAGWAARKASD